MSNYSNTRLFTVPSSYLIFYLCYERKGKNITSTLSSRTSQGLMYKLQFPTQSQEPKNLQKNAGRKLVSLVVKQLLTWLH